MRYPENKEEIVYDLEDAVLLNDIRRVDNILQAVYECGINKGHDDACRRFVQEGA